MRGAPGRWVGVSAHPGVLSAPRAGPESFMNRTAMTSLLRLRRGSVRLVGALAALGIVATGCGSSSITGADSGSLADDVSRDRPDAAPRDADAIDATDGGVDAGPRFDLGSDTGFGVDVPRLADVDPLCALGAYESCVAMAPGPCPNLADGVERTVDLRGRSHELTLSCAGRMTSIGPDVVLPLTVRETSDVTITAVAGTGDTAVIALYPAGRCGEPTAERECNNASSAIGGIATFRAPSVPPGEYVVAVVGAVGTPTRVFANLRPARPRQDGDLCPGIEVPTNGTAVPLDASRFTQSVDYGTTCGAYGNEGLGWTDAVFRFTTTETRDVTLTVEGSEETDLSIDVSGVCGARSQTILGCTSGRPATRTLRNLAPGTWYAVVDYRTGVQSSQRLAMRVTTAAPTPPSPVAVCPGLSVRENVAGVANIGDLLGAAPLTCLRRPRVGAYFNFTTAAEPADYLVNVAASQQGSDAAFELRSDCADTTATVGECTGPADRTARSVWRRFRGLNPSTAYTVVAASTALNGTLNTRVQRLPEAAPQTLGAAGLRCDSAVDIGPAGGIYEGTTEGATALAEPACTRGAMGSACAPSKGAMYRLVLTESRRVVATLTGLTHDALVEIRQGASCPGQTLQGACNDDWLSTASQVDTVLSAGTYWVYASGCGADATGRYTLDVAVLPP